MTDCTNCQSRLAVLESLFEERSAARAAALKLAAESVDRRLDTMNQFRDQLREQAARFVTREEHGLVQELINKVGADILRCATKDELEKHTQTQAARDRVTDKSLAMLTTQFWMGGSAIIIVLGFIQFVVEFMLRR